jgi:ribose transport system substrate-binding protein
MAQNQVAKLSATTSTYPVPTASVSGVSKFKGRTVYYIPLIQQIPTFVVAAGSMKQALAKAGLSLQVCNGQGQPSAIAACVQQAVGARAAGIVTDAIPYGMAQNAFDAAKAKGVPIVVADQYPPAGTTNTDQVSYVSGVVDMPSRIAWWMIADSKGKANAIIAEEADSPSSVQFVVNSLAIYKSYCPGCTITVKKITASTTSLLASATSSNLLAAPGVTYYYTEFEDSLQPTIQGIQQSGRSGIALSVAAGTVDGLGLLKGNSVVKAVVVVDEPYEGWALTDEILRMMTKSGPVTETIPSRLFTKQNIGSIPVTPTAQSSGQWFGDMSFQDGFAKLWGAG